MSRRQLLFWLVIFAIGVAIAYLSGPPTCADLRGPENCPAAIPRTAP